MVATHLFVLCHNETVLIPHTVEHYRRHIPGINITVLDNMSTDGSQDLARSLGCTVVSWKSPRFDGIDNLEYAKVKNSCWKHVKNGWVIVCDMDEWLCITAEGLLAEQKAGTSVLRTRGLQMVGQSERVDVSDIDLHGLTRGYTDQRYSKPICFRSEMISDMRISLGGHGASPIGHVRHSKKAYSLKHMNFLGLPQFSNKIAARKVRAKDQIAHTPKWSWHYQKHDTWPREAYSEADKRAQPLPAAFFECVDPALAPNASSRPSAR